MQPPTAFDFVNRANAEYIDQMQQRYQRDPRSVPEAWQVFFAGFEIGLSRSEAPTAKAETSNGTVNAPATGMNGHDVGAEAALAGPVVGDDFPITMGVFDMVHSFRELGHFCSRLDPLGHDRGDHPLLHLDNFGMSEADLDRQVGHGSFLGKTDGTLRDLLDKLKTTYCSTIGVEYIGISDKAQRDWLQQRMEPTLNKPPFSREDSKALMMELVAAEEFEQFLARSQRPHETIRSRRRRSIRSARQ